MNDTRKIFLGVFKKLNLPEFIRMTFLDFHIEQLSIKS